MIDVTNLATDEWYLIREQAKEMPIFAVWRGDFFESQYHLHRVKEIAEVRGPLLFERVNLVTKAGTP